MTAPEFDTLAVGKTWSFKSTDLNSTPGDKLEALGHNQGRGAGKRHDESGHIRHLQTRNFSQYKTPTTQPRNSSGAADLVAPVIDHW